MYIRIIKKRESLYQRLRDIAEDAEFEIINEEENDEINQSVN